MNPPNYQKFAQLIEIGEQQLLIEVLPPREPGPNVIADKFVSTHLGWSHFETRAVMKVSEKGMDNIVDPVQYLLDQTDKTKAETLMNSINSEWGAETVVAGWERVRIEKGRRKTKADIKEEKETLNSKPKKFAKLFDFDGIQVVAVAQNDMGENHDQMGLLVKVGRNDPKGPWIEKHIGLELSSFSEILAKAAIDNMKNPGVWPTDKPKRKSKP